MTRTTWIFLASGLTASYPGAAGEPPRVAWKDCLRREREWYGSAEAVRIAELVLLWQRDSGGWPKNVDMAEPLAAEGRARILGDRKRDDATIDNGATWTQLRYLARVFTRSREPRFRGAFIRGLDAVLAAQYDNGGFPQCFPHPTGYHAQITFNDGAMVGVLELLRDIARGSPDLAFVEGPLRDRSAKAVGRGVDCILRCQIVVGGKRAVWCAQHDWRTLAPAPARTYEKASLSGGESVGVIRFLMGIERPGPDIVEAVEAAVAWLDRARVRGIRVEDRPDPSSSKGYDKVVVEDPKAPSLWARFYEIGSGRPIFCGRDGVVKYRLADIENERRVGYAWYVDGPRDLLDREYPAWAALWTPGRSVLEKGAEASPSREASPSPR